MKASGPAATQPDHKPTDPKEAKAMPARVEESSSSARTSALLLNGAADLTLRPAGSGRVPEPNEASSHPGASGGASSRTRKTRQTTARGSNQRCAARFAGQL